MVLKLGRARATTSFSSTSSVTIGSWSGQEILD